MKPSKRPAKAVPAVQSVNLYYSVCCKALAEKPAVAMPRGKGVGLYLGAKPEGDATLGKWHCSTCRRKCKVTPQARPVQETHA